MKLLIRWNDRSFLSWVGAANRNGPWNLTGSAELKSQYLFDNHTFNLLSSSHLASISESTGARTRPISGLLSLPKTLPESGRSVGIFSPPAPPSPLVTRVVILRPNKPSFGKQNYFHCVTCSLFLYLLFVSNCGMASLIHRVGNEATLSPYGVPSSVTSSPLFCF